MRSPRDLGLTDLHTQHPDRPLGYRLDHIVTQEMFGQKGQLRALCELINSLRETRAFGRNDICI